MGLLTTLLGSTSGGGGGGGAGNSVAGIILAPVVAASTTALTVTYANGSSGVGATLTNAGAQAAFALDGVSATVGQRVLIKNQSSAFQNGIYSVTTVGSGAANWVLTRSTDFDQAAEMTAGTQVDVSGGSTQAGSIWILSASIVTVGTTSVTFVATGVSAGVLKSFQVFTSGAAQTYTRPAGISSILVECVGGGAGGGGSGASAGQGGAAAGGGGGGYCRKLITNAAATYTYTVGTGGAGGATGANAGANGVDTTFSTLVAGGGIGGTGTASSAGAGVYTSSQSGGTSSGGDINVVGGFSSGGVVYTAAGAGISLGGIGGLSQYGGPAGGSSSAFSAAVNGAAGQIYGGGGCGGATANTASTAAGGAGADGIIIVWEFA